MDDAITTAIRALMREELNAEVRPATLTKCPNQNKGPKARTPEGTNIIRYCREFVFAWLIGAQSDT